MGFIYFHEKPTEASGLGLSKIPSPRYCMAYPPFWASDSINAIVPPCKFSPRGFRKCSTWNIYASQIQAGKAFPATVLVRAPDGYV